MTTRRKRSRVPRTGRQARGRRAPRANRATPRGIDIQRADVVAFIDQHAARIAAPDVVALVARAETLRERTVGLDPGRFLDFHTQVAEALGCLEDYVAGKCPQIPYYTVSVLAAALFYVLRQVDAVPDFLPRLGAVDDALVMAVAREMAAEGLDRYRAWRTAAP
jgi:uncharacterized membrane protein YkvA (DUF1232 family)